MNARQAIDALQQWHDNQTGASGVGAAAAVSARQRVMTDMVAKYLDTEAPAKAGSSTPTADPIAALRAWAGPITP